MTEEDGRTDGKWKILHYSGRPETAIFDEIQLVPLFLHFAVKLKMKIETCLFRPRQIYMEYLDGTIMRDNDEISNLEVKKVQSSEIPLALSLSIGFNP